VCYVYNKNLIKSKYLVYAREKGSCMHNMGVLRRVSKRAYKARDIVI
jgi:hypothetical protein